MTTRSLAFRLFAAAAAWVIGVLLVAGLLLVSYYRHATENAFDAHRPRPRRTLAPWQMQL